MNRNQTLLIGAIVGAAALLIFVASAAGIAILSLSSGDRTVSVSSSKMSRDEFRNAYMGKTKDEVLKALGKPKRTDENQSIYHLWEYGGYTIDKVTGKKDRQTFVYFSPSGRVNDINFY